MSSQSLIQFLFVEMNLNLCILVLMINSVFDLINARNFMQDNGLVELRKVLANTNVQQNLAEDLNINPQIMPEQESDVLSDPNRSKKFGTITHNDVKENMTDEEIKQLEIWENEISEFFEVFDNLYDTTKYAVSLTNIIANYLKLILDLKNKKTNSTCSHEVVAEPYSLEAMFKKSWLEVTDLPSTLPSSCASSSVCVLPNLIDPGCNLTYGNISSIMKHYNEFNYARTVVLTYQSTEWVNVLFVKNLNTEILHFTDELNNKLIRLQVNAAEAKDVLETSIPTFIKSLGHLTSYIMANIERLYPYEDVGSNLEINSNNYKYIGDILKKIINLPVSKDQLGKFKRSLEQIQNYQRTNIGRESQETHLLSIKIFNELKENLQKFNFLVKSFGKSLSRLIADDYDEEEDNNNQCAISEIRNGVAVCIPPKTCLMDDPLQLGCLLTYEDVNAIMERFSTFRLKTGGALDTHTLVGGVEVQMLDNKYPPNKIFMQILKNKFDEVANPLKKTLQSIQEFVRINENNLIYLDKYVLENIEHLYPTSQHFDDKLEITTFQIIDDNGKDPLSKFYQELQERLNQKQEPSQNLVLLKGDE